MPGRGAEAEVELLERLSERDAVAAERVEDAGDAPVAVLCQLEQEHPAVALRAAPADEPGLLGTLDELGDRGLAQVESLAQLGHGRLPTRGGLELQEQVVALRGEADLGCERLTAP